MTRPMQHHISRPAKWASCAIAKYRSMLALSPSHFDSHIKYVCFTTAQKMQALSTTKFSLINRSREEEALTNKFFLRFLMSTYF